MKRRDFLKGAVVATSGLFGISTLTSFAALPKMAPNDKINIAQIGFGRIAKAHDLPKTIQNDMCRIIAVADFDINRARDGKKWIEDYYTQKTGKNDYVDVKVYQDYREILKDKSIDAVIISTPDHWHAQPAIEAALAGKDIYLQKPAALTIAEGRQMSDVLKKTGRIFQIGSQQRSVDAWPHFKRVCELVRNGKIGQLKHIKIGLPGDPSGPEEPPMPVPANLNYNMWLGSTPEVYYTENRVHPQNSYDRPGWLRCEQFGAGMITGWGAHHVDIAHWAMGTELTGPVEIEGRAEFPKSGIWDVHGDFDVHAKYANGVTMHISGKHPNGIRFEGTEGWVFVTRSNSRVTNRDPVSGDPDKSPVLVSDRKIYDAVIGPNDIHLYESPEQHLNWLQCIRSRKETVAPAEVAHRSCSACLLGHIAMKLPRKLYWNPNTEEFVNDPEANAMVSRPQRKPYGTKYIAL